MRHKATRPTDVNAVVKMGVAPLPELLSTELLCINGTLMYQRNSCVLTELVSTELLSTKLFSKKLLFINGTLIYQRNSHLDGGVSSVVVGDVHGTEPSLSEDLLRYGHLVLRDLDLV